MICAGWLIGATEPAWPSDALLCEALAVVSE
jgi:hypothetical protein